MEQGAPSAGGAQKPPDGSGEVGAGVAATAAQGPADRKAAETRVRNLRAAGRKDAMQATRILHGEAGRPVPCKPVRM